MLWPLSPTSREGPPPRGGGEGWGGLPGGERPFPPGEPGTSLRRCGPAEGERGTEGPWAQGPTRPPGAWTLPPAPPPSPGAPCPSFSPESLSFLQGLPQTSDFLFLPLPSVSRPGWSLSSPSPPHPCFPATEDPTLLLCPFVYLPPSGTHVRVQQHACSNELNANACVSGPTPRTCIRTHVGPLAPARAFVQTHTCPHTCACTHPLSPPAPRLGSQEALPA